MAIPVHGRFEGGTNGTTISTGNSGGNSGTAFDAVSIGASAAAIFDNAHAAHGSLAGKYSTGASSVAVYTAWSTAFGTQTEVFFRFYLYMTANPAAAIDLIRFLNGATREMSIQLTTAGKIRSSDVATTNVTIGTAIALNQWVRVEGHLITNGTSSTIALRLYNTPDSLSITDSASAVNASAGAQITEGRFGLPGAGVNLGPIWIDDIAVGDAASSWIGPVPSASFVGVGKVLVSGATAETVAATGVGVAKDTTATGQPGKATGVGLAEDSAATAESIKPVGVGQVKDSAATAETAKATGVGSTKESSATAQPAEAIGVGQLEDTAATAESVKAIGVGQVEESGATAESVKATGVGKMGVSSASVVYSTVGFTATARVMVRSSTAERAAFTGVGQERVSGAREILSTIGFTGSASVAVSSVIPTARIHDTLVEVDGSPILDADVRLRRLDKPGVDVIVPVDDSGFWEVLVIGAPGGTVFEVVESVPKAGGGRRIQRFTFDLPGDQAEHWVKELV